MTLEDDCEGEFAAFSKKRNEQGEYMIDKDVLVCTCREYCGNQSGDYFEPPEPLEVKYGTEIVIYNLLPKCRLYSNDNKKVRKVKKIKVSPSEKPAEKINAESNVSINEKSNEDLLKKIKEILGEVKK